MKKLPNKSILLNGAQLIAILAVTFFVNYLLNTTTLRMSQSRVIIRQSAPFVVDGERVVVLQIENARSTSLSGVRIRVPNSTDASSLRSSQPIAIRAAGGVFVSEDQIVLTLSDIRASTTTTIVVPLGNPSESGQVSVMNAADLDAKVLAPDSAFDPWAEPLRVGLVTGVEMTIFSAFFLLWFRHLAQDIESTSSELKELTGDLSTARRESDRRIARIKLVYFRFNQALSRENEFWRSVATKALVAQGAPAGKANRWVGALRETIGTMNRKDELHVNLPELYDMLDALEDGRAADSLTASDCDDADELDSSDG